MLLSEGVSGAALTVLGHSVSVFESQFTMNEAAQNGGAIAVDQGGNLRAIRCSFQQVIAPRITTWGLVLSARVVTSWEV
jgi:predicted outer membrane repeat protein